MAIDKTLIDQLLADYKKPEDIIGENGLLKQLTKAILERALQAELTDHLGFEKHNPAGHHSGNSRNGTGRKALKVGNNVLEAASELAKVIMSWPFTSASAPSCGSWVLCL